MISFYNIWNVARIEIKTLLRSWFFRIFSVIALVFIGFWNFALLSPLTHSPWVFRGLPSTIPYVTILFLNSVQAVIAVFLASDFLKRDKKLDTTEVVYMRSMTNADYVTGKTIGILVVFLCLNAANLFVAMIMNIFIGKVSIAWSSYLLYPLLISLPTLVFILGLSFLFMVLIRNQAVTFIVLLGYIGVTLFYLSSKANYIFDYMSYNIPLMRSEFAGFAHIGRLLVHRGIYFLLGLAFVCLTIIRIRRLPQSRGMTGAAKVVAIVLIAASAFLCYVYINEIASGKSLRTDMVRLGDELVDEPVATPLGCDVRLEHQGGSIAASAHINVANETGAPIGTYIFTLNPGLEVAKVTGAGGDLRYARDLHILRVTPAAPLEPGQFDSFTVYYSGTINEEACYIDIREEDRSMASRLDQGEMMNLGKRYAFVTPKYLLLTPETMWYPSAGSGYSSKHPEIRRRFFTEYTLQARTAPGMTAVSQGRMENPEEGLFTFHPEYPLPSISLTIADYEKRAITVDSVEYCLYIKKGHDFFSQYFTAVQDTLPVLIRDARNDAETRLGLEYRYPRLTLVEVPIHFQSYRHLWSVAQETVQPEMVLLPEKGLPLRSVDFRRMERRDRRISRHTNETQTEAEKQSGMITGFVTMTLTESSGFFRFRDEENPFAFSPSYNVFPNFLTFTNDLVSDRWPVLNMALEAYYAGKLEDSSPPFARFFSGMSTEERINTILQEKTLQEILADREKRDLAHYAIKYKGDYLFLLLENMLGEKEFTAYLEEMLENGRFRSTSENELVGGISETFGIDVEDRIASWYSGKDLPAFIMAPIESRKVLDGDRERYQVSMKITNSEPVEGIMKVTFRRRMGGGEGFMRRRSGRRQEQEDEYKKTVSLGPGETAEFGFTLDYQPGRIEVNTLVSRNIPSVLSAEVSEPQLDKKAVPFEGKRILDSPVRLFEPGDIIVDNEDPGFKYDVVEIKSLLKRLFPGRKKEEEDKYVGMVFWRATGKWQLTTDTKFFGDHIRSACFTKKGKGDRKASWNAEIKESGYYDVYAHISRISMPWRHRDQEVEYETYHYLIHHDDGIEDTVLELASADDGWNFLGSYYISAGTGIVEITNESDKGNFIIADAIKWVKR